MGVNDEIENPFSIGDKPKKKQRMPEDVEKVNLYVKKDVYHAIKREALNTDKYIWEVVDKALRAYIDNK